MEITATERTRPVYTSEARRGGGCARRQEGGSSWAREDERKGYTKLERGKEWKGNNYKALAE
jgi:hypothetical protein